MNPNDENTNTKPSHKKKHEQVCNGFKVLWTNYARETLAHTSDNRLDPLQTIQHTEAFLAFNPKGKAQGVTSLPEIQLSSCYWIEVDHVIIVYSIHKKLHEVHVEAVSTYAR